MAEKVTWMELKVDLDCPSCYKDVKKILAKFPEIRDQVYVEQKNLVKITVVCNCPEKIRDKLCCKGGGKIKSIRILEQPKRTKQPTEATDQPKTPAPSTATEPKHETTKNPEATGAAPVREIIPPQGAALGVPVPTNYHPFPFPFGFGCPQCFGKYGCCPCCHGYGKFVPPLPPYYNNYFGYGYGYSYGN